MATTEPVKGPVEHIVLYPVSDPQHLAGIMNFIFQLQQTAVRDEKPYITHVKTGTTRPLSPVRSLGNALFPQPRRSLCSGTSVASSKKNGQSANNETEV